MLILVIMASLSGKHGLARGEPIDRNLIFRISKAGPRLSRDGALRECE
jgi:hypothetical protein